MPIRGRVTWGENNPLSDPRFSDLDQYVSDLRRNRRRPNVAGGGVFDNHVEDLPVRPNGYYTEYDVTPTVAGMRRDTYRIVLGIGGEVYITGNHYRDFLQIINMPMR
jgi:filamentous hemagglutinin